MTTGISSSIGEIRPLPEVSILGIPFTPVSLVQVHEVLRSWVAKRDRHYITLVNPHSVMCAQRDESMRAALTGSGMVLADGAGISLACKILNYPLQSRIPGTELMVNVCDWGRADRLRHFFYGGGVGVAEEVAGHLSARFPGLSVVGVLTPPFHELSSEEDAEIVERINAAEPDVVWVALGTGKQERWMLAHLSRVKAVALVGVGAAFDFLAGRIPRAPGWMRRMGIEWGYRLVQEPRRLWRRNLDSPVFLAKVMTQKLSASNGRNGGPHAQA